MTSTFLGGPETPLPPVILWKRVICFFGGCVGSVSVSGKCGHADMTIVQLLRLTDANALIVLAL